jgi:hypothetical protein
MSKEQSIMAKVVNYLEEEDIPLPLEDAIILIAAQELANNEFFEKLCIDASALAATRVALSPVLNFVQRAKVKIFHYPDYEQAKRVTLTNPFKGTKTSAIAGAKIGGIVFPVGMALGATLEGPIKKVFGDGTAGDLALATTKGIFGAGFEFAMTGPQEYMLNNRGQLPSVQQLVKMARPATTRNLGSLAPVYVTYAVFKYFEEQGIELSGMQKTAISLAAGALGGAATIKPDKAAVTGTKTPIEPLQVVARSAEIASKTAAAGISRVVQPLVFGPENEKSPTDARSVAVPATLGAMAVGTTAASLWQLNKQVKAVTPPPPPTLTTSFTRFAQKLPPRTKVFVAGAAAAAAAASTVSGMFRG